MPYGSTHTFRPLLASGLLLAVAGCSSASKESSLRVEDFITRVTDFDGTTVAILKQGALPQSQGGPNAQVSGVFAVINGGSSLPTIDALTTANSPAAFNRVIVGVVNARNFYELSLFQPADTLPLLITFAPRLDASIIGLTYAVADNKGVGNYSTLNTRVLTVGTGDIQVSVAWDALSDVDLHVLDPTGAEVYFGNNAIASGGTLDLDSNPNCVIDNKNNENVVWPLGRAIPGNYTVRVEYYAACGVPKSDYVVTVRTPAGVGLYPGTLTGLGTGGGAGAGQLVTNFTY